MYKVLIADDETIMRTALSEMIVWNKLDCELVYLARNGIEAWEFVRSNSVDLAILDIRMPGLNGLQVCQMMRQEGMDIPVIILSAYSDYALMRDALRNNVCDYVIKTSFEEDLPDAVRKALAKNPHKKTKGADAELLQPNAHYSDSVNQVIAFLRTNYANHISIRSLADMVYLNPNYLCRLYKRQTGNTILHDLTQYRIHQAKLRLAQGETVNKAAVDCGFENAAYFTYVFTKLVGTSPGVWKNNHSK